MTAERCPKCDRVCDFGFVRTYRPPVPGRSKFLWRTAIVAVPEHIEVSCYLCHYRWDEAVSE